MPAFKVNYMSYLHSCPPHDISISLLLVKRRNERELCKTGLGIKKVSLAMGKDYEGGHFSGGLERSESHVLLLDSYTQVQQPRWPLPLYISLLAEP